MPALPSPGAIVQTNLSWMVEGDTAAITRHFWSYTGGAPSAADVSTLAAEVTSAAVGLFGALLNAASTIGATTARDLSSDMGNEATAGTPGAGTRAGDRLSPGTAAVVSHSISRHYRGGHPRTYLPLGSGPDIAVAGTWETAFVFDVDSAWGAFVAAVIGNSPYGGLTITNLVNVAFYGPPNVIITNPVTGRARTVSTVRSTPVVDPITGHVTRTLIGSQRRRNRDA